MTKWTDSAGREWVLKLTPPEMSRLRDASGIDVYRAVEGSLKFDDIAKVFNLVWASIEAQAKPLGVSRADFEEAFGGVEIDNFVDALNSEMIRFFPSAQQPTIEKIRARQVELRRIGRETLSSVTEAMIDEAISKSMSGSGSELLDAIPPASTVTSS